MSERLPTGKPVVGRRSVHEVPEVGHRLGVGLVGLHEGMTMLAALRQTRLCHSVGGCDVSEEKLAAARARFPYLVLTDSLDELLARSEVDIIAIYTPDALHAPQIEAAFCAGKCWRCGGVLPGAVGGADRRLEP